MNMSYTGLYQKTIQGHPKVKFRTVASIAVMRFDAVEDAQSLTKHNIVYDGTLMTGAHKSPISASWH